VRRAGQKLLLLFGVTALVLNFPVLGVVNRPAEPGGLPLLPLFLFAVWAGVIAAVAILARSRWDDEG
jgi:hypothetical protein